MKAIGVSGSGIQKITVGAGLTPTGDITSTGTVAVDTGFTAGKIVKVEAGDKLPEIDASQLTNLNPSNLSGPVPVTHGGTGVGSVGSPHTLLGTNASGNALEYKAVSTSAPLKLTNSPGNVALELETVPVTKGGTGLSSLTANRLYRSNDLGSGYEIFTCYAGTFVSFNALGEPDCLSLSQMQSFVHGGNTFDTDAVLGTNDSFPLHFKTDGVNRLTILPNGNVGIATATPQSPLHVNGSIRAQEICDLNGGNCKNISGGWGNLPAASMVENWPDAVVCDDGLNKSIMYHDTRDNAANLEYYSKATTGHMLRFNATTGAFYDASAFTGVSACSGKSIATLIAEGRTYGLLGGGMDLFG